MSKCVNKVILVGNVGKDPEVKYSPGGTPVAKFSLATDEKFKDRSGEWQERVEWHSIIAWQRLAEIVGEYVVTGSKVYVEGKLQTSSWEDRQSGQTKYRTEIVARDLVLLNSPGNGPVTARKLAVRRSTLTNARHRLLRTSTISHFEWTESCSVSCR